MLTITSQLLGRMTSATLAFILRRVVFLIAGFLILLLFSSVLVDAQTGISFSYSYLNITRNSGGGTLEKGDIIEIRALGYVESSTVYNVWFIDSIRSGTQYIPGSLRVISNEGVTYEALTDATNDDAGVFDALASAIRVNLGQPATRTNAQSGANLYLSTGGGTIKGGTDKPIAWPGTLGIVAYRLRITADFGDTIRLGGNYYYKTSSRGSTKKYHFNDLAIKVIQNQGLCNDFTGASFTAESSFGSGNKQNRSMATNAPGYTQVTIKPNEPHDNYYAIVNNTSGDGTTDNSGGYKPNSHRVFGAWDIVGDHTGASDPALGNPPVAPGTTGGYMLLVNANYNTGLAYQDVISGLCPNTYYEFSAWIRNLCGECGADMSAAPTGPGFHGVKPNLTYTINGIDYYTTGDIDYTGTWVKRGFIYKTGPTESSFVMGIKNNSSGGDGNDWVLDDINLATCYPNLTMNPTDQASACAGQLINLYDTIRSYFNNYTYYCWEKSLDGITWSSTGNCGLATPVLKNGLWEYIIDTAFIANAVDSGSFFRVKVATTSANLADGNCAVMNSQKVFMKIRNYDCGVLAEGMNNFAGRLENGYAVLSWTSSSERGIKNFEIQKSQDGVSFKTIATIAADHEYGGSYTYQEDKPLLGNAYYRIRINGQNESQLKYSRVVNLYRFDGTYELKAINPFVDDIKIELNAPLPGVWKSILYDGYGRLIRKKDFKVERGQNAFLIEGVSSLTPGIYILTGSINGTTIQQKIMKVH